MEAQINIIKTDDTNVVIEKITFNTEVNILSIQGLNEGYENVITQLEHEISTLNDYKTTSTQVQKLIEEKIAHLKGEIFSYQEQLNNNLKYLNT
jgi:hypothetical protein